jgi:hypothetical protein
MKGRKTFTRAGIGGISSAFLAPMSANNVSVSDGK